MKVQWEYRVDHYQVYGNEYSTSLDLAAKMNELGKDGWRTVSVNLVAAQVAPDRPYASAPPIFYITSERGLVIE